MFPYIDLVEGNEDLSSGSLILCSLRLLPYGNKILFTVWRTAFMKPYTIIIIKNFEAE